MSFYLIISCHYFSMVLSIQYYIILLNSRSHGAFIQDYSHSYCATISVFVSGENELKKHFVWSLRFDIMHYIRCLFTVYDVSLSYLLVFAFKISLCDTYPQSSLYLTFVVHVDSNVNSKCEI